MPLALLTPSSLLGSVNKHFWSTTSTKRLLTAVLRERLVLTRPFPSEVTVRKACGGSFPSSPRCLKCAFMQLLSRASVGFCMNQMYRSVMFLFPACGSPVVTQIQPKPLRVSAVVH